MTHEMAQYKEKITELLAEPKEDEQIKMLSVGPTDRNHEDFKTF